MIPVTILTGYLGAGKTTLLNHIIRADHGMRIAVLVNDFGKVNVDASLIAGVVDDTITLTNGCICCTIRGDLVDAILKLVQRVDPPNYIIIEASGISDPAQIILTFTRSIVRNHIQVDSIITVVDAETAISTKGKPQRLIADQVRVADIVIVNKTDLVDENELAGIHDWIKSLVDRARIINAVHAMIPIEAIIGIELHNPQRAFQSSGHGIHMHDVEKETGHSHHDHSLVFGSWYWESREPLKINQVRQVLDQLPGYIFRAKGFLALEEVPDRRVQLQMVGKRVSLTQGEAWQDENRLSQLVLIGEMDGFDVEQLRETFDSITDSNKAKHHSGNFVDGVLNWLRLKL